MKAHNEPAHRYEALAGFVAGLVDNGTLRPGSRAPSLRQLSKDRRTSLSTALQAYQLLEDHGVLEARPRSGFYVAKRSVPRLKRRRSRSRRGRRPASRSPRRPQLGRICRRSAAGPARLCDPERRLLAAGRLDRFLARAARVKGTHYNVYTTPKGDRPCARRSPAGRCVGGRPSRPRTSSSPAAAPRH